jgi:Gpi18-like mannosyltransferase
MKKQSGKKAIRQPDKYSGGNPEFADGQTTENTAEQSIGQKAESVLNAAISKPTALENLPPWFYIPFYLAGVFFCVLSWDYAGYGTAIVFTVVMMWLPFILRLLLKRDGLCRDSLSALPVFLPFCAVILARLSMFEYVTLDYEWFLQPWVIRFRNEGGFALLGQNVGNYNVPYLTFLAGVSRLPMDDLYLIKLVSVLFDVVLAYAVFKLATLITDSPWARIVAFLIPLILPTVFLNGAVWGQCDSLYAAFCTAAIYFALRPVKFVKSPSLSRRSIRNNSLLAFAFAGLAIGQKLQAVFIAPIFLVFLFTNRIKLKYVWSFVAVYLVTALPAIFAGRGFTDALFSYFIEVSSVGTGLNYNSPSVFALRFFNSHNAPLWGNIGMVAAAALVAVVLYIAFVKRKTLTNYHILLTGCIFAIGIPLFLPHMHDRYFYLADVLIVLIAVKRPKFTPLVLLVSFASFLGYYAYLRQRWLFTMNWGFYALLITLVVLIAALVSGRATRREGVVAVSVDNTLL